MMQSNKNKCLLQQARLGMRLCLVIASRSSVCLKFLYSDDSTGDAQCLLERYYYCN